MGILVGVKSQGLGPPAYSKGKILPSLATVSPSEGEYLFDLKLKNLDFKIVLLTYARTFEM